MKCDGVHEIDEAVLSGHQRELFERLKKAEIIREAGLLDYLTEEQEYRTFPVRYKQHAHWSVTGACNMKCRHCFMSAPHARHGSPTKEQLLSVIDQLAECGIFTVGLTGGSL